MVVGLAPARHVFEPLTATGGKRFSYLTCLHIFSLVETISRDHCPVMWNAHFQFPSVAQERRFLKLSNILTVSVKSTAY